MFLFSVPYALMCYDSVGSFVKAMYTVLECCVNNGTSPIKYMSSGSLPSHCHAVALKATSVDTYAIPYHTSLPSNHLVVAYT